MNTQFVIVTKIVGKQHFIINRESRFDDIHFVDYDTNKENATVFDTFKEAETFKDKISNPFHRVFTIEYL